MKSVLGLASFSPPMTKTVSPHTQIPRLPPYSSSLFPLKPHNPPLNFPKKFLLLARASDDNKSNNGEDSSNPLSREGLKDNDSDGIGGGNGNGNGGEDGKNRNGNVGGPGLNLKWVDLLLDPDPDNVVAVGLTGVLAWASAQVLCQLFVISVAILLAALKYSFIAALLIFILITLL